MLNKSSSIVCEWKSIACFVAILFAVVFAYEQYEKNILQGASASSRQGSLHQQHDIDYELTPKKIEEIRLGNRLSGINPDISDAERAVFADPEEHSWKAIKLEMRKADGSILDIELLRPIKWFEVMNPVVGKTVFLDLLELGAWGQANVISIEKSPEIHSGPGNVVTGRFAHKNTRIVHLTIEGISMPVGCTESHPFWSDDRMAFVEAGNLHLNELLRTHNGKTARLLAINKLSAPKNVYNLEVHNEHVYEITDSGILVHNACEFILHHAVPKFLGGHDQQLYAILKTAAHTEYHALLREALHKRGLWEKAFTFGTKKGSASDWVLFFKAQPGAQYEAFEAVLESGAALATKYPDEAMKLLDAFWDSLRASKWTPY